MIIINWIAEYMFSLVESLMSFIFCEAFLKKRSKVKNQSYVVISLVLAAITITLNSVQLFSLVNTAIFFILFCVAGKFFFETSWIKIIGVELTYFAILFLLGTIVQTIAAQLAGMSAADVSTRFSGVRIIGGIISNAILIVLCIGLNKILNNVRSFGKKAFALGFIGTIILIILSAVIYYKLSDSVQDSFMITLLFVLMLALLFSTFIAFIFFLDSQQKKQENELIRQQNQWLERSLTEQENTFFLWRQSIHDYKNTILTLDSYITQNRLNELTDHIRSEKTKFEQSLPFFRTGNSTVDTIINTKHSTARKRKILFSVNAKMPEKCVVSDIQLAAMIGNLLDNAIEAQEKEFDPFIHVQISIVGELLIIKIVNRCSFPPENSNTTKRDRQFHGIGLRSVERTARQYGGDFSLKYENETAVATVVIPNKT